MCNSAVGAVGKGVGGGAVASLPVLPFMKKTAGKTMKGLENAIPEKTVAGKLVKAGAESTLLGSELAK